MRDRLPTRDRLADVPPDRRQNPSEKSGHADGSEKKYDQPNQPKRICCKTLWRSFDDFLEFFRHVLTSIVFVALLFSFSRSNVKNFLGTSVNKMRLAILTY